MKAGLAAFSLTLAGVVGASPACAQALSLDVEAVRASSVGATWQTVDLVNTYTDSVVACTYVLASAANPPATVRMRNAGATSFEVRLQQFENSSTVTAGDVHCLVVDAGVHTLSDGREIEAHKVLSNGTSGLAVGWGAAATERVDGTFGHTYTNLVLLGQVMTFNDANATVIWTNNCSGRGTEPNDTNACVGKHIGQINNTRADETIGYITIEAGTGTANDVDYAFGITSDSIAGVGNSPAYNFTVSGDFYTGVLTQAAEDGGQGGWAVLFGADPLPNNTIGMAIEEEVVAGDTTRRHTQERVYYGVFEDNQTADITAAKSVAVSPLSATPYAVPGSDVVYTITGSNAGSSPIDDDSVVVIDTLPAETEFFNGDMDGGGLATLAVYLDPMTSGLAALTAADIAYSDLTARPTTFAACAYTPAAGYDLNVRHVCVNPKGVVGGGTLEPDPQFAVSFRARIN